MWGFDRGEGGFPAVDDVCGEGPGFGEQAGLVDAAGGVLCGKVGGDAGEFVVGLGEGVAVVSGAGGVEPEARRCGRGGDETAEEKRGEGAGVVNLAAVFGVVAAVDGASGEMDDGVGAVELIDPGAGVETIPRERLPLCRLRVA